MYIDAAIAKVYRRSLVESYERIDRKRKDESIFLRDIAALRAEGPQHNSLGRRPR
jgi:hypothetical protein